MVVGLFAVSVIRRDSLWGEAGAFLLAVVPTAMASALNPAFRIAPVTAVILMLGVMAFYVRQMFQIGDVD